MRVILVPVADRPECVISLRSAFALARQTGADVIGCHMRPDRSEKATISVDSSLLSGLGKADEWPLLSEEEATTAATSARLLFERLAAEHDVPVSKKPGSHSAPVALWQERVGTPPYIMPIIGPASDMLVVSRPTKESGRKARALLSQALFSSHRPVLILPQHEHTLTGKRIAIGWNRGGFESRTLLAILPLLKTAEDVVFLTVGRHGKQGPKAQDMIGYLAHHGVTARHVMENAARKEGQILEKLMREEGAEMIASGAYSRSRFKEMVFGGVTHYLLNEADIPVLMMHH